LILPSTQTRPFVFFKIIGHKLVEELYILNSFQAIQTHLIAFSYTIQLDTEELCKSKQIQYMTTQLIVLLKIIGHNFAEELFIFNNFQLTQTQLIAALKTIKLSSEDQFTFTHIQLIQIHPIVSSKTIQQYKTEELCWFFSFETTPTHLTVLSQTIKLNMVELCKSKQIQYMLTQQIVFL
jgi:hypothetical protein